MMNYKISELIKSETKSIEFDLTCAGNRVGDDYEIDAPIRASGRVWYENDDVCFEIDSVLHEKFTCSRCLTECSRQREVTFRDELAVKEFLQTYGDCFELCAVIWDQIILHKPIKFLCSEDCKGLCCVCGQNLNLSECGCETKEYINPQFADLANWRNASGKDEEV